MKGFIIDLENHCEYCPAFVPKVEKTDITSVGDSSNKAMNIISCEYREVCKVVKRRVENG